MVSTIPNKEIIRRVCHLHGATKCYLHIPKNSETIEILTNIPNKKILSCENELESWADMKFKVSNFDKNTEEINKFISYSEKILPIKF